MGSFSWIITNIMLLSIFEHVIDVINKNITKYFLNSYYYKPTSLRVRIKIKLKVRPFPAFSSEFL